MFAQRRRNHLLKQTAAEMHERQPTCRRKTAAFGLSGRLAEMFSQLLGVGHREAGAVCDEEPVAEPEPGVARALSHLLGGAREKCFQGLQGQSAAGFAEGGPGDPEACQARHFITGGIAAQDLQQEKSDGGDGVELAVTPFVTGVSHGFLDGLVVQLLTPTLLELFDELGDTGAHLRASVGSDGDYFLSTEARCLYQIDNNASIAMLSFVCYHR